MKVSMHQEKCVMLTVVTLLFVVGMTSALDQTMKDHILDKHNAYRRGEGASNMARLEWDAQMESEATSWAGRCEFKHKGMGENLAWNSNTGDPEQELIDKAMTNFFNEKTRYSYGQPNCGSPQQACHYTQLVWAKTTKVGCVTRICQPLKGAYSKAWFLVCRYSPEGNWVNEKPFEKGPACSKCNGATCSEGLCVGGATKNKDGATENKGDAGEKKDEPACEDSNTSCSEWAKGGECDRNPSYMKSSCKKSCNQCLTQSTTRAKPSVQPVLKPVNNQC